LYESDFIFGGLLQTALQRFARQARNAVSVKFDMALAAQKLQKFIERIRIFIKQV